MMNKIDQSKRLGRMLDLTSAGIARRRGLPIVIGILLVTVALIIQLIGYATKSDVLEIAGTIIHSVGVLFALIGLAVSTPLGK